jgi:uncharacterized membrane protein
MCDCAECQPNKEQKTVRAFPPKTTTQVLATEKKPDPIALAFEPQGISPWRRNISQRVVRWLLAFLAFLARRWLSLLNAFNFMFVAVAVAVPLAEGGGLQWLAKPLMAFCSVVCVQNPGHSFYLGTHQMALCQRCLAIYAVMGLLGLFFGLVRQKLKPLKFWQFILFCLPIAVDGLTQLFGWRESTWDLRFLTGGLFALGVVWYLYPGFEAMFSRLKIWVSRNRQQINSIHA